MKPELVLALKTGENPEEKLQEWLKEYNEYATAFLNTEDLAAKLSARAKRACLLIVERSKPDDASSSHDDTYYEEIKRRQDAEDAELDGGFPLGNEHDAEFAVPYFPVADLVSIQLGYHNSVRCGYYTEYNYAVLVRKGFISELNQNWLEAARCYEGVSGSESVQNREYECRRRAKAEGVMKYAIAQTHMESGEWHDVYRLLEEAAEMGNLEAETDLGLAYAYGNFGVPRYTDEALKHLRRAAGGGCARAAFEICELYDGGVDIDVHEAMEMCEKAAESGIEKAKIRLEDGFDLRPKREILKEQIDKGNIDAIWKMVWECEDDGDSDEAVTWLIRALEAGQVDALLYAAECRSDKSLEMYDEEAADWFYRQAADAGSIKAMIALGDRELKSARISFWDMAMLLNDPDEECKKPTKTEREEHKKQFAWYEKAAEAGDIGTIISVAESYMLGYPVGKDYEKAFLFASRGADEGDVRCMYTAAHLYENGFGVEKDIDAAIMFYTQAAESGVRAAALRLYLIYSRGLEHIAVDPQKASHFLFLSGEGRD